MKSRKQIALISLVILIVYNIISFLIPSIKNNTFWIAYGFSNICIIITALTTIADLDEKGIKSQFNNIPLICVSCTYLIIQLIIGFIEIYCTINFRYSILLNVILLGLCIIGFVGANVAKKYIQRTNKKIQEEIFFIKDLQVDIETFSSKISDMEIKKELNLLADSIRYSDSISHSKLVDIEKQINEKVKELIQIVDDNERIKQICEETKQLIQERNIEAKICKSQPEQIAKINKTLNFKIIMSIFVVILVLIIIGITAYYAIISPNTI